MKYAKSVMINTFFIYKYKSNLHFIHIDFFNYEYENKQHYFRFMHFSFIYESKRYFFRFMLSSFIYMNISYILFIFMKFLFKNMLISEIFQIYAFFIH